MSFFNRKQKYDIAIIYKIKSDAGDNFIVLSIRCTIKGNYFQKKKKLRLDNFALFRRRILLLICRTLHFIPVKNPRYVRLKGTYTIYINRLRNIKIH